MNKLVVVGNGMAGVGCVEQILKYSTKFEITIFGEETHVNYNRILLSSVLAGEKAVDDIALNSLEWYRQNQIELRLGVRITDLNAERGQVVAIFNLSHRFLALENSCPHRGGPLADGIVWASTVVCPLHAWKVDLFTGSVTNQPENPLCVKTFPARVEGGAVFVDLTFASVPLQNSQSGCLTSFAQDSCRSRISREA